MRHPFQNQWGQGGSCEFFEKAYRRDSLAIWDAKWQGLSVSARRFFLDVVKLPGKDPSSYSDPASVPADRFPPNVLTELGTAGFVEIRPARFSTDVIRVLAGFGIDDFAWRARILRRHHLLDSNRPSEFSRYVESLKSHLAFMENNPLYIGHAPDQVAVFRSGQRVPRLEEELEAAGKRLLDRFVIRRLIPLGCVRAAIDDEGRLCIAREPRLEVYFGRKVDFADLAPPSEAAGRVVVQPDFSVIVIGLNPASVAELTPFCERTNKTGGQGATVLKITRDAVVKAVGLGMKPADMVARLARHAHNDVPANVLQEINEWANWVRHVVPSKLSVLRCGDPNTADRVMSVLEAPTPSASAKPSSQSIIRN